jgi:NAD+ diphosphatase
LFAGSPLNRLSWLRSSHSFLNAVIVSPATRWLLFNAGQPLVVALPDDPSKRSLVYLTTDNVKPFLGSQPFFGQGKESGQLAVESSNIPHSPTEAARHRDTPIVFLGILEPPSKPWALTSSDFSDADVATPNLEGTPYFSMDVADLELTPEQLKDILNSTSQINDGVLDWSEPRILMSSLDSFSGGLFAEARSMVDWNQRNKASLTSSLLDTYYCPREKITSSDSFVQHVDPVPTPCGAAGNFRARHYCRGQIMLAENRAQRGNILLEVCWYVEN